MNSEKNPAVVVDSLVNPFSGILRTQSCLRCFVSLYRPTPPSIAGLSVARKAAEAVEADRVTTTEIGQQAREQQAAIMSETYPGRQACLPTTAAILKIRGSGKKRAERTRRAGELGIEPTLGGTYLNTG